MLFTALMVVFLLLCVLLILVVMLQSGKEAGMGIFGGGASQTVFGARRGDILSRATAVLSFLFLAGALALAYLRSPAGPFEGLRADAERARREAKEQPGEEQAATADASNRAPTPPAAPAPEPLPEE
jgi:preprotein translocase subunit SecG